LSLRDRSADVLDHCASMAIRAIHGIATDPSGAPLVDALFEWWLDADVGVDGLHEIPPVRGRIVTGSDGSYQFSAQANADITIPPNSAYQAQLTVGGSVRSRWQFVVTDNAYPPGLSWLDMATLVVAVPPADDTQFIQGPTGPQGPPGGHYEFQQPSASSLWHIVHNLGFTPSGVSAYDTYGAEQVGAVSLDDPLNSLWIAFGQPVTGIAICG